MTCASLQIARLRNLGTSSGLNHRAYCFENRTPGVFLRTRIHSAPIPKFQPSKRWTVFGIELVAMAQGESDAYKLIVLTDVEDPKVKEAVQVLLDAYKNDVVFNNLVGGLDELREMTMNTAVRAGIVGGEMYVALDQNDKVVGTAIWYPPGHDFLSDEKQQKQGAGELFEALQKNKPDLHAWWISTLIPTLSGISNKYLAKNPEENVKLENWTLYSLSVAPAYQGRGISRLLVQVGEEKAAKAGLLTCFNTDNEKNLAIYKRLGYRDAGFDAVPGPPGVEGYNLHALVKEPKLLN